MTLHLIFFFFFFLLLHPSSEQQQLTTLDPKEMAALRDIRSSLRDLHGSSFFSTWDFASNDTDPCTSFSGIICSQDDGDQFLRVSVLTLGTGLADSPGLTGTLSSSITDLTALTEIVIHPGRIGGSIPTLIGTQCRRLRLVSISNNLISDEIPISLAGLPGLHTLDLGHNRLTGSIPSPFLESLPNLKVLILVSNSLSGTLPSSLFLAQLLHLDVGDNSFTGLLPPLPPTLRFLSATANSLSGSLDAAFSLPLPQLSYLDLSMNGFTESIPSAVFGLPKLSTLLLQRNSFSGSITLPQSVSSWAVVDLSHNMITGEIPAGLAAAASLYLNNNKLTGPVPEEYAKRVYTGNMTTLYAQHNFLTAFPSPSQPLPQSVTLCLSYNCMAAPPSTEIGCPVNLGTQQSRPPEQCHNNSHGTGDEKPRMPMRVDHEDATECVPHDFQFSTMTTSGNCISH